MPATTYVINSYDGLENISFKLHPRISAFIGQNGSGKSRALEVTHATVQWNCGEEELLTKYYSTNRRDLYKNSAKEGLKLLPKIDWESFGIPKNAPPVLLSGGQRALQGLFADIALHFKSSSNGSVFIDHLEGQFHPSWQRKIVSLLLETFPTLQFVITTNSPFIIQSMPPNSLINMDNKGQNYTGETQHLSIEDISETFLGIPMPQRSQRYQNMMQAATEYYKALETEITTEEEKQALKEKLDALTEPFSDNPAYMAFLKMERLSAKKF